MRLKSAEIGISKRYYGGWKFWRHVIGIAQFSILFFFFFCKINSVYPLITLLYFLAFLVARGKIVC